MATKNFMSNILDELMGRNRDALPTDIPKEIQWDDPEICPYYLVCFCPHELFVNTKADLGTCSKFHDDQLRKKYLEEAPIYKRSQFEKEFLRFAEKMISDIEGKIKRGKHRIAAANGADGGIYAGPGSRNAEEIVLLTDRINVLLEEAEAAGCEGDVEKAQGIMKLCDQIKEEREKLKSNEISHPWNPDKAMQVCEVCGSYLIIGEAQHRLDDHIMGKQHVGFAMLRKNMEDVRKALQKREADDREQMELERERRLSSRRDERTGPSPNSDRRRDDSRRGGSDRGRDSYRRGRERDDRDVDRDRDRKRHRSRSRDKDRKDKEKDKDRHRDKDKDKDRKRHSSRDRRRHSDSKRERRSKRSRSRSKSKSRKRSRSKSRDRKDKDRHSHRRNRDNDKDNDKGRDKDAHPREEKEITGRLRSGSPGSDKMEENSGHIEKDVDDAEGNCSRKSKSPCPDSSNLADATEEEFQGKESPASSGLCSGYQIMGGDSATSAMVSNNMSSRVLPD